LQLRLCGSLTPQYNWFDVFMLTNQRVMMIHKKIIEHHGRVESVKLFNRDPTQYIEAAKERAEA